MLLELSHITKTFGGVPALRDAGFALKPGEIHGIVGENGAGKSTLMKIIAGVHADYQGQMRLDGNDVRFTSPRDARAAGIGMVHQELSIVPSLSVAENVHLGVQPVNRVGRVDWRGMRRSAREHLASLGIDVGPDTLMAGLPLGQQQMIEVARVLYSGARIIILDEPTSALAPPEVERLIGLLHRLRDAGRSIIFISHFLDDVLAVCDRVTVFRNGTSVASESCAAIDKRWIIDRMIGAGHDELEESYLANIQLRSPPSADVVLRVDGLTRTGAFHDISFHVLAGEVLGIYGFLGAGHLDLARGLFGIRPAESGKVHLKGQPIRLSSATAARRLGMAFVPESRRMMLFGSEPVYKNATITILERISRLWLRPNTERAIAGKLVQRLNIRPPDVSHALGKLSGGNQQKVALAKWLTHFPHVLVLSEPTRGMDVGAKDDVVKIVRGLRQEGIATIVVSTEPETVLSLADRILVMKRGGIVHQFAEQDVGKDQLLEVA